MPTTIVIPMGLHLRACGGTHAGEATNAAPRTEAQPPVPTTSPQPLTGDVVAEGFLLPPVHRGATSFGASVPGSHPYAAGGYFGTPHASSRGYRSDAVWRLDLAGSGWEALPLLDTGLQGIARVTLDGHVVRVGGTDIRNPEGEQWDMHSAADVAWLDARTLRRQALPPLPEARSSLDAVVIGGALYAGGGWTLAGSPEDSVWHDTMLVLEPGDGEPAWRAIAAPFRRRALAAAAGEVIVAVGGMDPDRQVSARVDVYDTRSGTWSRGPDLRGQPFGVAAAGVDGAVLASGSDGAVWRWEAGAEGWTRAGELAFPRFFHRMVDTPDAVAVPGGIGRMRSAARVRHLERFDPAAEGPRVATWEMPNPGEAKNRQGMIVRGETLHLFCGNDSVGQRDFEPDDFLAGAFALHLPSLEVLPTANFPVRRQTMQTVQGGGRGFAVGGFGHDGEAAVTHPEVYVHHFEADAWSERPGGLPRSRSQLGVVEHDGHLLVFGGLNDDPSRPGAAAFEHLTDILRAPVDEPETALRPIGVEMPGPRRAFAGAVLDGRYYTVGGMREAFDLASDCVVFDFEERSFEDMPCPDRPRLSGEVVALGGRLYLAGGSVRGEDGMEPDPRRVAFDPASGACTVVLDRIPLEPKHLRMMAWGEQLLLYSAHDPDRDVLRLALNDLPTESRP